jgi:ring-1,2-phenylacetyl-CoA epoxidase subunit PaaD
VVTARFPASPERASSGITEGRVWEALHELPDPEIPVISLVELGVVREVAVEPDRVRVDFAPTFMGCPALDAMVRSIRERVEALGAPCDVRVLLDDSWSTDDISPAGREKLRAAGFAPPTARSAGPVTLLQLERGPHRCPYCGSAETRLENLFGPTPCRSLRYCTACRQPFEQFKTI